MLRKVLSIILMCSIFTTILGVKTYAVSTIDVWTEDALVEIKKTALKPSGAKEGIGLVAAKNEYESYQIALRSQSESFTIQSVEFSNLVSGNGDTISSEPFEYHYELFKDLTDGKRALSFTTLTHLYPENDLPDPLSNDESIHVSSQFTQPIWLNFFVPKTAVAGDYSGTVTVNTTVGSFDFIVRLEVCDVTIPDSKDSTFKMYNWAQTNAYSMEEDFDIGEFYGIEKYTDEWWTLIGNIAEKMVQNRQNTTLVWTMNLLKDGGTTVDENGQVTFNWSLFDQYIAAFQSKGITYFGGGHLARHWDGTPGSYWKGEDSVILGRDANGNTIITGAEVPSAETESWLNQYLPALKAHLIELGIFDNWYQHVYDEPSTISKWTYLADKVHTLAPGLRTLDADGGHLKNYASYVDVWVPLESAYEDHKAFYDGQKELGKEVFSYTCLAPEPPYLNRLNEQPNLTNQLLFWYSFKNRLDGYLHWGYNAWGYGRSINHLGDAKIVYPDPDTLGLKSSVRNELQRDGLEDMELLRLLAETNEGLADRFANSLVSSATVYATQPVYIRKVRSDLVRAAAGEDVTPAILINNTDAKIEYTGSSWYHSENRTYSNNINGDAHHATGNGEFFEYTFKGTGIDVITEHKDGYGLVDVYFDGIFKETIDLYGTSVRNSQYIAYSIDNLPYGEHTIKMVKKSGNYMLLDAFVVKGTVEAVNLALNKPVIASNVHRNMDIYTGDKINDGDMSTRWATDKGIGQAHVEINFGEPTTFNKTVFVEWKGAGDRIDSFKIQYYDGSQWVDLATGNTADPEQINYFDPVTSEKIRLVVIDNHQNTGPTIYEFGVYND